MNYTFEGVVYDLFIFISDIDECENNVCDVYATCTNLVGSFECNCNAGFSGDGYTCFGTLS